MSRIRMLIRTALAVLIAAYPLAVRAADSTVSALTAAGELTGAELLYCVQGGADRKCTATQTASLAGGTLFSYGTGFFYTPLGPSPGNAGGATHGANTIRCFKGIVGRKLTTTNLGTRVNTLQAATNMQFAIYNDANGRPGTLIGATASASLAATGGTSAALSAAKQIGPGGANGSGSLWWCANTDATTAVVTNIENIVSTLTGLIGGTITDVLQSSTSSVTGVSCTGAACNGGSSTFGTWPDLTGSTWTVDAGTSTTIILFDVTSIP